MIAERIIAGTQVYRVPLMYHEALRLVAAGWAHAALACQRAEGARQCEHRAMKALFDAEADICLNPAECWARVAGLVGLEPDEVREVVGGELPYAIGFAEAQQRGLV